ncbi:MAG: winged helix-turn-helix transcriptional regulator [Olsenella sp.]|nr:winged helix-turn-helix transcriptional regulator [Olsenella sp.]
MTRRMPDEDAAIHPDLVEAVSREMPCERDLDGLERLFDVLGDRTRIRILLALSVSEMCVQDLATLLGMTKSAVSHQLSNLKDNRLVASRREGRIVYYSCADEHVEQFMALGLEHASGSCRAPGAGPAGAPRTHDGQSED